LLQNFESWSLTAMVSSLGSRKQAAVRDEIHRQP
jgi:hypothetical protein